LRNTNEKARLPFGGEAADKGNLAGATIDITVQDLTFFIRFGVPIRIFAIIVAVGNADMDVEPGGKTPVL